MRGTGEPDLGRRCGVVSERGHAVLAWEFVSWAVAHQDPAVVAVARQAFAAGFDVSPPTPAEHPLDALIIEHGHTPARNKHALAQKTCEEVLRPAARELL